MQDEYRNELINCPSCDGEAVITYEEDRIYKCTCRCCTKVIEIKTNSYVTAIEILRNMKIKEAG